MLASIENISDNIVTFELELLDGSKFIFELPKEVLPKNKGIGVGTKIKFNMSEVQKFNRHDEENDSLGGFVKNPPKRVLKD
ncbi:MAG TPA: hypothetical protein PLP33_27830 [Leptospiraceae bacterium]|nr:hypothetical protein [Leptospiraceae bacterium]